VKIIFAGVIAREPLGGPAWVWLQYLLGFRRLGHEVYFLEESGDWPYVYNFEAMEESDDPHLGACYIQRFLEPFGLDNNWAYRAGDLCLGMPQDDFVQLCHEADLLIALPTSVWTWRPEYDAIPMRLLLDVDPGFTQFRAAQGDDLICTAIAHCNRFFTYGPYIGREGSRVPSLGLHWQATRPPVVLEEWPLCYTPSAEHFTTLMQWSLDEAPRVGGETYGQKDVEFARIMDLPRRTSQQLEVAVSGGPDETLREHGWHVQPAWPTSRDPQSYRAYIQAARGEFSVAKNGYVKTRCGWVSDRTTCFLASGKPAIVQETGMSEWLPTGEGLLTFSTPEEALAGIEAVNGDYELHCRGARQLAEEYLDSDLVLTRLLNDAEATPLQGRQGGTT
jgi:hypothetical protein